MNKKITLSTTTAKQTNNGECNMLKNNKLHTLINFQADIFMCEEHNTASNLRYCILRLLSKGKLIDAFHWQTLNKPMIKYTERDNILVSGKWTSERQGRFQIIRSQIVTRKAANEDIYSQTPHQFEFDFGDINLQKG